MPKKAFVTGATGFIGANLVRLLLQEDYRVRVLVRPTSDRRNLAGLPVEVVEGGFADPDLAKKIKDCEVLFHVGAYYSLWQRDREQLYRDNVVGTRQVLAAARLAGVKRTVYTSSVAAIGVGDKPVDETHQSPVASLVGHYKKSKYYAEQEAQQAAREGQDVVIVNPSTPIGAWDLKPTPTGEIVLRFLRRQMPVYLETGLNFVYVGDVARGHLQALERGRSGERYILGHENLTLKALLDQLQDITGLPSPNWSLPAWLPLGAAWVDEKILARMGKSPSIPVDGVRMAHQYMYYDCHKAKQELNLPQTPLPIALREAVHWFRERGYCD